MHPISLDATAAAVLGTLGHGREYRCEAGALILLFRRAGGKGLILTARADDTTGIVVRVWCESAQWCNWIAPVLPVSDWCAVPTDLHTALAAWTLARVAPYAEAAGITWPQADAIEPGACPITHRWLLRIEHAGTALDLHILDAPSAWITQLAARLELLAAPSDASAGAPPPALRAALIVGWSCVDAAQIARLRPGDALLLHRSYDVAAGSLGLFTDRPLASATHRDAGHYTIGDTMNTFDDWLDVEPAGLAPESSGALPLNARVRIVVQAAAIDVPLEQLAALKPGDILEGPAIGDGLVTLKVAGKPLARGILLDIDGRLAVRIDHFT